MARLSGSRYRSPLGPVYLAVAVLYFDLVLAQDPFSDVLSSNTQLWKSFQEEMKTLEHAAHRVNTLLSNANHPSAKEDQITKSSENKPVDVTVLASPDMFKNGIRTKPEESNVEENENKKEKTEDGSVMGGVKQTLNPHLSLGSFINSFGFFKNLPEPWWKGKNVCVEKSEKEEVHKEGEKQQVDKHVIIMGTGTFEHCKQTAGKYICTTVMSTPQSTKTVSTTYQCCEGFRRQADGCVQGEDNRSYHPAAENGSKDDRSQPENMPHNNASPDAHYKSLNNVKSTEDNSFSSQSDETNGQPRWLEKYFKSGWLKK